MRKVALQARATLKSPLQLQGFRFLDPEINFDSFVGAVILLLIVRVFDRSGRRSVRR